MNRKKGRIIFLVKFIFTFIIKINKINNYLLKNQYLSCFEIAQSLFVSEYGLRHLKLARSDSKYWLGHAVIATIELMPIVGLVGTATEIAINFFNFTVLIYREIRFYLSQNFLFEGSQEDCEGNIVFEKVQEIINKLNNHPKKPKEIVFDQEKLKRSIHGGTCGSMALEFMDSYFNSQKIQNGSANKQSLNDVIKNLKSHFLSSSEEMRNLQSAFNTITISNKHLNDKETDHTLNKIQAVANFYGLAIRYSSKEIDLKIKKEVDDLKSFVENLSQGAYLVRIIQPKQNVRLEKQGHSFIYTKENNQGILYDANQGAINLGISDHFKNLIYIFNHNLSLFQVHKLRFYQMEPL